MTIRSEIRPAVLGDVAAIDGLVRALALYERDPGAVVATPDDFRSALFGPEPRVFCHVAEVVHPSGERQVVGMALWFVSFSTWRGSHGIWLEDLFVHPDHRGRGLGRALLAALAAECGRNGWARLEWWVLDWNTPAHGFYRQLGAHPEDDWTVWRLDGEGLDALGT